MNNNFQYGRHGGHLGFPIGTIFASSDLQVTQMIPTKFQINLLLGSGEEVKNRFQDGRHCGHLGYPIGTILGIFELPVTLMLPIKFRVDWPFG